MKNIPINHTLPPEPWHNINNTADMRYQFNCVIVINAPVKKPIINLQSHDTCYKLCPVSLRHHW